KYLRLEYGGGGGWGALEHAAPPQQAKKPRGGAKEKIHSYTKNFSRAGNPTGAAREVPAGGHPHEKKKRKQPIKIRRAAGGARPRSGPIRPPAASSSRKRRTRSRVPAWARASRAVPATATAARRRRAIRKAAHMAAAQRPASRTAAGP